MQRNNLYFSVLTLLLLFSPTLAFAKNLSVPFTSQAPYGYWGQPWQDTCEETAILMVDSFYNNKKLSDKSVAKQEILRVLKIKTNAYGKSLDENAEQMAKLINDFLIWEATVVENPTLEQIKLQIDASQPVIIPAYGKALKNPRFRNGGPEFHTIVISGYDDDKKQFITQEPGTSYGLDFRYDYDTLMNAIHDFLPNKQTKNGRKAVIFTSKNLKTSADADGDKDGLTKTDELKYGTITWLKDSDGDGYSDGLEVAHGFSPTKKPQKQ